MFVDWFVQRLSISGRYLFEDQVLAMLKTTGNVAGGRKNQTFDSLDLFDARFFLTIFDHFCENFCKIKQYIKQIWRFFHVNQRKKFILWKSFVSMKLFIYLTIDIFSIRSISVLGSFSSKWFFSDVMDSRSGRKNWILTLKTLQLK